MTLQTASLGSLRDSLACLTGTVLLSPLCTVKAQHDTSIQVVGAEKCSNHIQRGAEGTGSLLRPGV